MGYLSAEVKSMKEWALYYAELGLAVFPLAYRNKVPAIEGGCKAATTEKSKIERWWNQNPRYNIGIATGNKSNGLVVIDLDVDKNKGIDGYEVLRDWQNKHGELPETWQSITGRGGYHYFYKDTITHSNKVGLYEGVDIRGEGGYIVAPPSVHPNGNTYEWEQEPKEYEIAQVDDIVNDFFKGEKQRIDSEHKTNFKVPELIPEGKRVDLKQVITAITRTLGGLFDVLEASGTAGKIAAFLGKAFIAVKIADITGIGSLVKFLVTTIGKKLITEESVQALAGNISNLTNSALAGSTSGIATFASSLGSLVGTAGAITLVTAGTVMLTKKIAELVETAQGGNGILTQTGGYLHDYAGKMGEAHAITNKQVEELWALVEADETAGKSNSEMYDSMVQKLGEYGVSAEKATQILEQYGAQAGVSSAFVEEMTGKVQALGKGFSESSSTIDTSSITVKESIKGIRSVLYDLSVSSSEYAGTYRGVLEVFNNTSGSAANAQDAFNIVYNALKEAGVPLDELNKKLAQEFPSAAQATKSSVDSSIVEAQKTVSSSTGKMKTDAETNLAGVKKAAEDASGGVNTTTVTNWGNSASEVKKNLDKMKQTANLKLGEMQKTVESHFSGQYNTMTKKWEKACERIGQLITQMVRSTKDSLNGFTRNMNTIGNEMSNNLINGISGAVTGIAGILNEVVSKVNSTISNVNSSLSGIEKAFTFSYDVTTPDGKRRWGKYSMNLPRVNTVPYLAKGAVIPPRSEFLAVLGDQKQGNNIETPEALLRKIVREETAGRQAGGGSYRFTAQINRRTLFDEMMKEAQMRRDTSGRNPFEMA